MVKTVTAEEMVLAHKYALKFGGEKGIISDGLIEPALYGAHYEAETDSVNLAALIFYKSIS